MDGLARIEGLIRDFRANVVSFCGADDEAIHWLHYGRSGTGVAIGVDGCALQVEQFALCPVIYDQKEQDEYLFALLAHVDKFVGAFASRLGGSDRALFNQVGAHLTTAFFECWRLE